jgi:hypothetical protein
LVVYHSGTRDARAGVIVGGWERSYTPYSPFSTYIWSNFSAASSPTVFFFFEDEEDDEEEEDDDPAR